MTSKGQQIAFVSRHIPYVKDGDYRLDVSQDFQVTGGTGSTGDSQPAAPPLRFAVKGPRFSLAPNLVQAQFPPAGSIGRYFNCLPHIIFRRSTLPWERNIDPDDADDPTPWLALLVFDQREISAARAPESLTPRTVAISDFIGKKDASKFYYPDKFKAEASDPTGKTAKVNIISVSLSVLQKSLPSKAELKLLAHVRHVLPAGSGDSVDDADPPEENLYPFLVGLRLPEMGSETVVHLVSLEGHTTLMGDSPPGDKPYRLITLGSWRFASIEEKLTFADYIVGALDHPPNRLTMDASGLADPARTFLDTGYAPMPHQTRQGNHLVSWYRGPFLPGTAAGDNTFNPKVFESLASTASDPLVRYVESIAIDRKPHDVRMLDVSYAAAWEMGRLLTLQSQRVAVDLFNWKRQRAHAGQAIRNPHLPFHRRGGLPPLPATVARWFRELALLTQVPFNYLVPHPQMLPRETLRLFEVDPFWLGHLIDGALSIGRVLSSKRSIDKGERDAIWDAAFKNAAGHASMPQNGFLLRSHVVEGWPHLHVAGYAKKHADEKPHGGGFEPVRLDRLGKDVLLCLFDRPVRTIDLFEVPEAIHFGVSFYGHAPHFKYFKAYRDYKSGAIRTRYDTGAEPKPKDNYAKIEGLSPGDKLDLGSILAGLGKVERKLHSSAPDHAKTSWWAGLQMIEGVQKVRVLPAS